MPFSVVVSIRLAVRLLPLAVRTTESSEAGSKPLGCLGASTLSPLCSGLISVPARMKPLPLSGSSA